MNILVTPSSGEIYKQIFTSILIKFVFKKFIKIAIYKKLSKTEQQTIVNKNV